MAARDAGLAETIVSTTPVSRRNRAADTKRITTGQRGSGANRIRFPDASVWPPHLCNSLHLQKLGEVSAFDSIPRGRVMLSPHVISGPASWCGFIWGSDSEPARGTDLFGLVPLSSCGTPGGYSHCHVYTILNPYLCVRVASCLQHVFLREDGQVDRHGLRAGTVSVSGDN